MADRRRVTVGGFLVGAATTAVLFTVSMPAIVSADGGQTDLIHACLLPHETGSNVVIIGASESCPGGTTALHWPAVTPDPPEAESPEVPPTRPPTSPKIKKKLYGPAAIRIQKTKTVSKTLGPSNEYTKELTVSCTASHPYAVTGHSEVVEPQLFGKPVLSHPVGLHAWYAVHNGYASSCSVFGCFQQPASWTMKLSVTCAMVKPQ